MKESKGWLKSLVEMLDNTDVVLGDWMLFWGGEQERKQKTTTTTQTTLAGHWVSHRRKKPNMCCEE